MSSETPEQHYDIETPAPPNVEQSYVAWLRSFLPTFPVPRTFTQWTLALIAGAAVTAWQAGLDFTNLIPSYFTETVAYASDEDVIALRAELVAVVADFRKIKEQTNDTIVALTARVGSLESKAPTATKRKPLVTGTINRPAR